MIGTEGRPFPSWLSFHLNNRFRRRSHPPEIIVQALRLKMTDVVLDFGCGPGFYTIPFAKNTKEVVAADIQTKMLRKVSEYAEKNRVKVKVIQSDGQKIPLPDGSIDLIFLSGVYHELVRKREVLTELKRVLKPIGKIVIRERTGHYSMGRPTINLAELSEDLMATGFAVLAPTTDPSDDKATLVAATPK